MSKAKDFMATKEFEEILLTLYPENEIERQKSRYSELAERFESTFGSDDVTFFSAPGRTEVGGNHTDHNHGRVLAASVNLDALAAVRATDNSIIREQSTGHGANEVDISTLDVVESETGHSSALIRGVCAGFVERGYKVGGFDACVTSDVLSGSGLSSSAAYEVLIGTILNHLYNDGKISAVEIAQIAQFSENKFFGKPCGLMDQTASSVGGFVTIDFNDPSKPIIEKLTFDFASCSHALCIVNTGGSHNDLTADYAAVRSEMEAVAAVFGKSVLRDVDENEFFANIDKARKATSERAVVRAIHFFGDNERVLHEVKALKDGDFESFKKHVTESGFSSFMYNQNVYTTSAPTAQPVAMGLSVSDKMLKGKGAWRVHGGGFAGTIQAFVPICELENYRSAMDAIFGEGSCMVLKIRPVGGIKVK
ncbi:MAG: galactokinase [Clostridia bacterium]|nr:galactokinase [Clostridia bacterium]